MIKVVGSVARTVVTIAVLMLVLAGLLAFSAWVQRLPRAGDELHNDLDFYKNETLDRKREEYERLHGPLESDGKFKPEQFKQQQ